MLNSIIIPIFNQELKIGNDILPIGLSFHTFQSVGYVIDVYKGKVKPEKHLGIYSTYVLFFPQMVAGPIERFSTLGNELKKTIHFSMSFVKHALPLLIIGFFYKMVIADNCGEYVNNTYSNLALQNNYNILIAIFLFCIQIYSDFFGYSLIAQGSAKLFGITLIDNFSFPFFSNNVFGFWKKWHISLTSWFRDYLYIPLGGNKRSTTRYLLNIVIIFTLSGLWHGAGLNFILWGFIHSICYIITVFILRKIKIPTPIILNYITTFIIVSFIFVFFRNGALTESISIFKHAFLSTSSVDFQTISWVILLNILFILSVEFFAKEHSNYHQFMLRNQRINNYLLLGYMLFAIITFSGVDNLPFIYFQF